jgi:hypothetical protein
MTGAAAFSLARPLRESSPLATDDTISGQTIEIYSPGSTVGPGDAWWSHDVCIEIKELSLLSRGWDGDVANSISTSAIDLSRQIAIQVANLIPEVMRPSVIPTVNGGVALEWHTALAHLEIVVEGQKVDVFYSVTDPPDEWEGSLDEARVNPAAILQRHFR